ncbi:MAG: hypothetical protein ONB11_03765 [candidate division KSB1 bacterium]|nr:hypothetical protein [candidate division KSB1 bacterium]MDZ7341222.1 hypothetical protein [candidate division KSB1 bacterium]
MEAIVKTYDAKLDNKKRLTIRGTKYEFYRIQEFDDGTIVLKPRILVDPDELSENSLAMMDNSIKNFKKGNVSKPIDLRKYLKLAEEFDEV